MMTKEIKQLGLPTMISNSLARVGVDTFDLLLKVEVKELKTISGLGAKGIEYILALVSSKGYKLEGQELYEQLKARKKAKRQWIGLTDEEVEEVWKRVEASDFRDCVHPFAQAIGAKLKEKNT
jgi:hypothetical protein